MPAAAVGSVVKIYVDTRRPIHEFDVISTPTGRCYVVMAVRVQQKGKRAGRQHLQVMVADPNELPTGGQRFMLHWYKRRRRS